MKNTHIKSVKVVTNIYENFTYQKCEGVENLSLKHNSYILMFILMFMRLSNDKHLIATFICFLIKF